MMAEYPKSEYVDDAEYWSAYALTHLDKKKATEAYKKFIVDYPNSNYYDDATADFLKLNVGRNVVTGKWQGKNGTHVLVGNGATYFHGKDRGAVIGRGKDSVFIDENGNAHASTSRKGLGFSYSYRFAPWVRRPTVGTPVPVPVTTPFPVLVPGDWYSDEKLDPETELKMDALYALGETKEDSVSFTTLRDVVVDPKQPRPLRNAAMDVLSNFKKYDVLNVYIEVAKEDTSEEIQNMAIDYVGQISSDKDKSVAALVDLFSAIPSYRLEKLQTVLWSIAEIGNRRAVNFLARIAKTHDNYALRSDAVHYLGSIGGDDARQALYEILKGK